MKNAYAKARGFTLVELLIVIVVIGVLATISLVAYNSVRDKAEFSSIQSDVTNSIKQLEMFKSTIGDYPTAINNCPAPSATTLCLDSEANTVQYKKLNGASPFIGTVIGSAYGLTVFGDNSFLYSSNAEITRPNEFVQYMNLAPIIDKYGSVGYKLSFDIKSNNVNTQNRVSVYSQNGSATRYYFTPISVSVSLDYKHHELVFKAPSPNSSQSEAWLAFYGIYGSGNIPTIKNVRLELAK